jgi:gliding motility-associated-like protein
MNLHASAHSYKREVSSFQSIGIDSVSVLQNGDIIIGWTYYTDITDGYVEVHRRLDSGTYGVISRVPMPQTFFIDNGINSQINPFSYYVVAYDSNDNVIGFSDNPAHQTIYVDKIDSDICGKRIIIDWQSYAMSTTVGNPDPLPTPFDIQQIWLSQDNGEFELIGSTNSQEESFEYPAEEAGQYCFMLRALQSENGITSSSNIKCRNVYFPAQPEFIYIRSVSVNPESNQMEILAYADNSIPDPSYVIEKYSIESGAFVPLDSIVTGSSEPFFIDPEAQLNSMAETFQVAVIDSCGSRSLISQTSTSVFLDAVPVSPEINRLEWTHYKGWIAGVNQYQVERKAGNNLEWEIITLLNGNDSTYDDNLALQDNSLSKVTLTYRIKAIEGMGNAFGFQDEAYSNLAIVEREIEIFVPNAFRPSSEIMENRVFKPVFANFEPDFYSMTIFNRWTEPIFSTSDINDVWDGSANGQEVQPGVYSYVISYKDNNGNVKEKRGSLLLIR